MGGSVNTEKVTGVEVKYIYISILVNKNKD